MNRLQRLRPFLVASVLVSLLIACGCSVKAPPRHTWSLAGGRAAGIPALRPDGPALGLTRFTATAETRTTALTWREAGGHLVHDSADSWVDYPDRMLEEMTLARFLRAGAFSAVTMAPPTAGLDAVLSCRLIEFGEWNAAGEREARVTLRWQLSAPDGAVLGTGEAQASTAVTEPTMSAVVSGHRVAAEQAIDSLRDQVVAALSR